ncbi:MAG: DUF2793 domain-containing protein [Rickettsiales bacterium]|jgi:hypothetical protein|nr:DUF2793 domain-containing protein [Rickettsiales bacterium]
MSNNVCTHTGRLKLPYILQAQAQKEVTHNQALNILDVLVNTVAVSISNTPPDNPNEGDIYIAGTNPEGIFDGNANNLAQYTEGSWSFYQPLNYMEVMVIDESQKFTFIDNKWVALISVNTADNDSDKTNSKNNETTSQLEIKQWQEDLEIKGKVVTSKNVIPHHSLVIAVNIWVIEEVTGVPSFAVGVKDDPSRYGDKLRPNKDTTNIGMTYHPITYYYDTPITIMPNQMEFTGGVVRVSVQYLKPQGSWGW